MNIKTQDSYHKDPKFQEIMEHLQRGEWESGLKGLDAIQNKYPLASKEIDQIRQETILKTKLDLDEIEDQKQDRIKKTTKVFLQIATTVLVIAGIFWGITRFDTWIYQTWRNITQRIESDIASIEQSIRFRDAQSYLQANYPETALDILQEMKADGEDYEGLEDLITQAETAKLVKVEYESAVSLFENGDSLGALSKFEELNELYPNYLDIELRIGDIKGEFYLLDLLDEAETAYDNGEWESASSQYETLRAIAPDYKPQLVETRLIRSYMNLSTEILDAETKSTSTLKLAETYFRKAMVLRPRDDALLAEKAQVTERFKEKLFQYYIEAAKSALLGQEDSLIAIETAVSYLKSALQIKPNDTETIIEHKLATTFLQAQIDFDQGLINQVIANLEYIYDINPLYANGTALQTLYESYMERGALRSSTGELESALDDFRKSAEIAVQAEGAVVKLYFAKVKIAETHGMLNNYIISVNNYKEAVELINLLSLLEAEDVNRSYLLKEAERYTDIEWYRTAYRLYRQVLPASDLLFDRAEVVVIKEGDYLSRLANIYGTTVQEILDANELPNAGDIRLGQEIIIPVIKDRD